MSAEGAAAVARAKLYVKNTTALQSMRRTVMRALELNPNLPGSHAQRAEQRVHFVNRVVAKSAESN